MIKGISESGMVENECGDSGDVEGVQAAQKVGVSRSNTRVTGCSLQQLLHESSPSGRIL